MGFPKGLIILSNVNMIFQLKMSFYLLYVIINPGIDMIDRFWSD